MIVCKCIHKFRDKQGRIYGYRIQDCNGNERDFNASDLKEMIKQNSIKITNLILTSDNRIIDKTNNASLEKKIDKNIRLVASKLGMNGIILTFAELDAVGNIIRFVDVPFKNLIGREYCCSNFKITANGCIEYVTEDGTRTFTNTEKFLEALQIEHGKSRIINNSFCTVEMKEKQRIEIEKNMKKAREEQERIEEQRQSRIWQNHRVGMSVAVRNAIN